MTLIIAVAGCSGSGKTSVSEGLKKHFGDDSVVISADSYYFGNNRIPNGNFDHPAAIDFELLITHLIALKRCETIKVPVYDFKTHGRTEEFIEVTPKKMIIVEGILVLHPEKLRKLFDRAIFVNTDITVCRDRRVERDIVERGRTREGALKQWEQVEECYHQHVKPGMEHATIVVENTTPNPSLEFDVTPLIEEITKKEASKPNLYRIFSLSHIKSQKDTIPSNPGATMKSDETSSNTFVV